MLRMLETHCHNTTAREFMMQGGVLVGLHILIQFQTRVFPTARRLARIQAMPGRFLYHCHACGGDVPESIGHIVFECPRWECHRRNFGALAP
jgi:hypothetical protein